MKRRIVAALLILLAVPSFVTAGHVKGYYRKDGTYVAPYERRDPGTAPKSPTTLPYKAPTAPSVTGVTRDSNGRIHRSEKARKEFMRKTGYPNGRPGYVIDHIIPLHEGGADDPSNMQWQTIEDAKAKDKRE